VRGSTCSSAAHVPHLELTEVEPPQRWGVGERCDQYGGDGTPQMSLAVESACTDDCRIAVAISRPSESCTLVAKVVDTRKRSISPRCTSPRAATSAAGRPDRQGTGRYTPQLRWCRVRLVQSVVWYPHAHPKGLTPLCARL